MKKGELEYAIRQAHNNFDRWNDVADIFPKQSGYYYEALSVIEDSVRMGAMMASGIDIKFNDDGELIDDA